MTLLDPADINYIKAEQGVTFACFESSEKPLNDSLDQLERKLDVNQFVRIHRSYLVNIDKIREVQRWFNGKLMVILNDNHSTELSTSRSGAEKLKALLGA